MYYTKLNSRWGRWNCYRLRKYPRLYSLHRCSPGPSRQLVPRRSGSLHRSPAGPQRPRPSGPRRRQRSGSASSRWLLRLGRVTCGRMPRSSFCTIKKLPYIATRVGKRWVPLTQLILIVTMEYAVGNNILRSELQTALQANVLAFADFIGVLGCL